MKPLNFQTLLAQVKTLNDHYSKIDELTGDSFNVFKILKMETSEVKLHSAFLAELLNPKGSHGLNDVFLKHFVKLVCSDKMSLDTSTASVQVEKYTGIISQDELEGGFIDILITDRFKKRIIIENKINAGDQKNQLLRYYNFSPGAEIIYLTLYGKSPTEASCGNLKQDEHFKCSSYQSDVLQWLEQCRKEAAIIPIVRESISQYINLIKYLTNQTQNQVMEGELNKILLTNLEASFIIKNSLDSALSHLITGFVSTLEGECNKLDLHCSSNINFKKNFTGIWITKSNWKYVNIAFQFQENNRALNAGFVCKNDPIASPIPTALRERLSTIPHNEHQSNRWWPWFNRIEEPFDDWSRYKAYEAIQDGSMLKEMIEKVQYLLTQSSMLKL